MTFRKRHAVLINNSALHSNLMVHSPVAKAGGGGERERKRETELGEEARLGGLTTDRLVVASLSPGNRNS